MLASHLAWEDITEREISLAPLAESDIADWESWLV